MSDTLVVLPTYNEKENIAGLIERILDVDERFDVLVVDDASPDGTAEKVRRKFGENPRVNLLLRTRLKGRGYAGVAGFLWGLDGDYKYIVEMDADGSHNPKYLPALVDALGSADMAICSRLVEGGGEKGRSASRRLITSAANFYLRLVLGLKVKDCTTGYRAFRREALEAVPWKSVKAGGPAIVQEVLYLVAEKGFTIKEIPFVFEERHEGQSKLNARKLAAGLMEAVSIRIRHGGAGKLPK